ncbi:acyltransferase [Deminuibacter soli]|nr:acyltransferase [Deminuibacter soli]
MQAETVARYENVDFAKGILIYLMVIFHIHYVGNLTTAMQSITAAVYAFHMPVFLIFSGAFAGFGKNWKIQIANVARRVFIPYAIFETIYLLSLFICSKLGLQFANSFNDLSVTGLLYKITFDPSGAYWYLHTITIGLIIALAVNHFLGSNKVNVLAVTGLCYWLVSLVIPRVRFADSMFLLIGMSFQFYKIEIKSSWFAIVPMVIVIYIGLPQLVINSLEGVTITLLAISVLYALFDLTKNTLFKRYMCFVGKNTLMVMLVHPIFLNICRLFYPAVLKIDPTGISYLVVAGVITVGVSVFIARISDQFKISTLLFGRPVYVSMSENQ